MRYATLAACLIAASLVGSASAQVYFDADGGGYRVRAGNQLFGARYNGYLYQQQRYGNIEFRQNNLGTQGMNIYQPGGVHYQYFNPAWQQPNIGFVPYYNQYWPR